MDLVYLILLGLNHVLTLGHVPSDGFYLGLVMNGLAFLLEQ